MSEPAARGTLPDLLDLAAVRRYFGGTRPVHSATVYRAIRRGDIPKPIKIGPNSVRWIRGECAAALARMVADRAQTP